MNTDFVYNIDLKIKSSLGDAGLVVKFGLPMPEPRVRFPGIAKSIRLYLSNFPKPHYFRTIFHFGAQVEF